MDTQTFPKARGDFEVVKESRLPAGSTLEVAPGVHVPHPQAAPNERLAPDPRQGDTKAVSVSLDGKESPLADQFKTTQPRKPLTVESKPVEPEPVSEPVKE
jgi:hypothetical protein